MRKFIVFIFLLLGLIAFFYEPEDIKEKEPEKKEQEIKGVFISYIDYQVLSGKNEEEMKKVLDEMIENVYDFKLNTIILQVRPFMDAIYDSKIFLPSKVITNNEKLPLDILKYMITKGKEKDIDIYAWINPYRISHDESIEGISKKNPYYKWLDTNHLEISEKGIYLNPASDEALTLILEGILEIVKNYDIKGILYDDYFYPTKTIDLDQYDYYIQNNENISIEEFRIKNINKLIKETNSIIKREKKDVIFSLSPAGNIENNLKNEYLDIKEILSKKGYIDLIIPQLYYGFNNTNKPYIKTYNEWENLIKDDSINLGVALSLYKSGKEDKYAGSGKNEWIENTDIIKKQILIARGKNKYKGFFIYRYDNLFKPSTNQMKTEVTNIKNLLEENVK